MRAGSCSWWSAWSIILLWRDAPAAHLTLYLLDTGTLVGRQHAGRVAAGIGVGRHDAGTEPTGNAAAAGAAP